MPRFLLLVATRIIHTFPESHWPVFTPLYVPLTLCLLITADPSAHAHISTDTPDDTQGPSDNKCPEENEGQSDKKFIGACVCCNYKEQYYGFPLFP